MALGANFNADVLLRRTCMDHFAAGAGDRRIHILGMNSLFHLFHLFLTSEIDAINATNRFYHIPSQKAIDIYVLKNCLPPHVKMEVGNLNGCSLPSNAPFVLLTVAAGLYVSSFEFREQTEAYRGLET